MYLLMTVFAFWDGQDAHQPQTGAAKQSVYHRKSTGYSQSASLLAHNRIAASQLIRSGLYHS